jgi:hypothetical protein
MNSESRITALVPDRNACRAAAARLRKAYPGLPPELLARKAISQAQTLLAATGAAAGVFTNPLVMIPLALGETGFVLKREARLVGVIAVLLEADTLEDPDAFAADILSILFPSAATQALSAFVVRASQATTRTLIRTYIRKDALRTLIRFAARYLGLKVTQRALITKTVPLLGAVIGAVWNWIEVKRLGARALRYFQTPSQSASLPEGEVNARSA